MTSTMMEQSAFIIKFRYYEYKRISFGLCNAPMNFQVAMDKLFTNMIGHRVIVYIDDINVYIETFEEYNKLLIEVLNRIRNTNL